VNAVFCPRKRGGVATACTPGTDWRQPRYDTEPTTARSNTRNMSAQIFGPDR